MFACTELDINNDCVEWVELVYGLPPLTQSEVYTLSASVITVWGVAFVLGVLVRMLLNSTASRHGA
jgi:hypothetical protein